MRRSWSCPPGQGAAMPGRRGGIRLRFDPGVDPEVRRALMQFVRWLQTQYAFPVRVPVYVRAAERLLCRDGDLACGTFLGPSDPEQEPYIRLAVGDYLQLLAAWGQDSALASILRSLAHELTHYFQWVRDPVGIRLRTSPDWSGRRIAAPARPYTITRICMRIREVHISF